MNARRGKPGTKELTAGLRNELMLTRSRDYFMTMVPTSFQKLLTPDRITKIILGAASRSPKLLECTPVSIVKSAGEMLGLGLEPGGPLKESYLVPFWNSKIGATEAQSIVGYRGLIVLARRSGFIRQVVANIVLENDEFHLNLARGEISHSPCLRGDRGAVLGAYSVAHYVDEEMPHIEWMSLDQLEDIRKRSKSADRGPWQTDKWQMYRKSVIRRGSNYWPMSTELAQAIEHDNRDIVDSSTPLQQSGPSEPITTGSWGFASPEQQEEPAHDANGEVVEDAEPETAPEPDPVKPTRRKRKTYAKPAITGEEPPPAEDAAPIDFEARAAEAAAQARAEAGVE